MVRPEGGESPVNSRSCSPDITFKEPRLFAGHNVWEWLFLTFAIINVICLIISSSLDISKIDSPSYCGSFTLQLVIIILSVMALVQAVYGFIREQQYDMYLHLIIIATALVFSILLCILCINKLDTHKTCCIQRIVFTVVSIVILMASASFAWKATTVPDWDEFRIFGASDGLLNMYKQLCYCRALLNWDLQTVITMAVFGDKGDDAFSSTNNIITFTLLCGYAAICWISGTRTVLKENKGCVLGTVILYLGLFIWFIYQLSRFIMNGYFGNSWESTRQLTFYAGFSSAIWAVVIRVYVLINLVKSCKNFDHGLSDQAFADLIARESTSLLARSRVMQF